MTILVEQSISGDGTVNFGGNHVDYVLVRVTTEGAGIEHPYPTVSDRVERVGWFALGARSSAFDAVERLYWREIVWINWLLFEYSPIPQVVNGPPDTHVWASDIQWHLSPGTVASLFVFGT